MHGPARVWRFPKRFAKDPAVLPRAAHSAFPFPFCIRAFALVSLAGCGSCGASSSPSVADTGASALEPPVPAPDGLLADLWIRAPDTMWGRVQHGASGALELMPSSAGGLVTALVGLDPAIGPLVDGHATSYGVLADSGGAVAWALALPLTDGRHALATLVDGDVARFTAHDVGAMHVLARGDRPLSASAAVANGWLLVAANDADLARLAPYAYRTLPTKPAPSCTAAVVAVAAREALSGPLSARAHATWNDARAWLKERDDDARSRHGGRAPDFGDPAEVLSSLDAIVGRKIALVADAEQARLEIDAGDDDVHADLFVEPRRGGAGDAGAEAIVAAMHPGDARPLADVSADAVIAMMTRDEAAARADDARDEAASVARILGARLRPDDAKAVGDAFDAWARARGDWVTVGVAWGRARALWLTTPAADGPAATQAVRGIVELGRRAGFTEPLAGLLHVRPPTLGQVDLAGLGKADSAVLAPVAANGDKADRGGAPPAAIGVAWAAQDGNLVVAAAEDAPKTLAAEAHPSTRLGDDPRAARAVAALDGAASFVLLAQPLRLDPARVSAPSAPALFAAGRRDAAAWVHLDLADPLLRELASALAGL
jgi:hypothetical protein